MQGISSGQLPGVVAVAGSDQGMIYEGAFGKRIVGQDQPMTVDSVFWIASMTKAVTTTAAMQLVEQGKLSLHDPASKIVPEIKSIQVLDGFDTSGKPNLRVPKREITLHHLLTHTAGFTYPMWDPNNGRYAKYAQIPDIGTCKKAALLMPLAFDPGTRWEYGINIDWAGQMVERVSGQSLEDYFRDHIFKPVGMIDTGFILTDSQKGRLAGMHARQPDGALKQINFQMEQKPEFFMGGGGLYSTAPDYLKFTQMFVRDGRINGAQVLRPETVAAMRKNQLGNLKVHVLKTADPSLSNDAEFFPGMPKGWSYGFMLNDKTAATGRSAGSLAWAGLANTYYWIDVKNKVSGVIMMQLLPFADGPSLKEFAAFEGVVNHGGKGS
ncbi:beta-lactamase family protein [Bradyrhizobium septentrionale]|uniref:serine hydrolase domain-containing protein n=1 Tax=Bradyrhizobium septentrionale TaxID=1404411 RepID=UPI001596B39C|nr:serine hydrolase domain-containing protein [Bradyrhizobium septentrionale]UGY29601.1 beta-lactamase family protein [Bradyrhizobium septentrionale]